AIGANEYLRRDVRLAALQSLFKARRRAPEPRVQRIRQMLPELRFQQLIILLSLRLFDFVPIDAHIRLTNSLSRSRNSTRARDNLMSTAAGERSSISPICLLERFS